MKSDNLRIQCYDINGDVGCFHRDLDYCTCECHIQIQENQD